MADICMCGGQGCPYSTFCYRHIAEPDVLQSRFARPPWYEGERGLCKCDYFWETRKEFKGGNKEK